MKYLLVLIVLLHPFVSHASEDCNTLGWHFYCDPEQEEAQTLTHKKEVIISTAIDPREEIKAIQERLNLLKATAIMNPSPKNVANYIRFQREQLDRASVFSDQWRRVIWQNPEMDYSLVRPTNALAKRAWLDERKAQAATTFANLHERYGLFYFYKGVDCTQCTALENALKPFAEKHNLHVMAVTLDGTASPVFPASQADTGQAERLGVTGKHLPALTLFDTFTNQIIPVGFGAMAADELERRIFVLTKVEVGNDY